MKIMAITTLVLTLAACAHKPTKPITEYFAGKKGCFLLFNMKSGLYEKEVGGDVCKEQFVASSTFKVPLAVIAFDSKILKDENQLLKWDGVIRDREVQNKDHNAKTWMSDSVVWVSQHITKQLGRKKLQRYLDSFSYGNRDLNGGLTNAWLNSAGGTKPALKISAYEQVEFMRKLWGNSLPVSEHALILARDITFIENSPKGFKLNGKTGSNFYDKERKLRLGWFVSHVQSHDKEYIAVTTFSDLVPSEEKSYGGLKAREITKAILADLGLY